MYTPILVLHSLLRWVVLLSGLLALGRAVRGRTQRQPWEKADARAGLVFIASMDLQVLLGIVLYAALSPITTVAMQNFGAAMHDKTLRFFAVEHATSAVLALVFAHVGRVRSRKAPDDGAKHGRAALFYGLAVLMLLLTIPWPFLPYGRPLIRFGG